MSLKSKGHDVVVGYGELGGANRDVIKKKNIRIVYVPMFRGGINIFKELKSLYHIWKIFVNIRPDLVHLVSIKPYLYGGIIARIVKIKAVVSAVAGLGILNNQNLKSKFLKFLLRPIFLFAFNHSNQIIIVQNKDDIKELYKWKVIKKNKIRLIKGSGVKLEKFKKLNEAKGKPVICFAARLLKDKGVFDYFSAAKLLHKKGIKAKFLLAGKIDSKNPNSITLADLKNIIKKKFLKYLGYQNNIPELFSKSHIVCLPSFYGEGLPKTLVEAAAASRVVVTTDHTGCREAIIKNKTGLLIPVQNPKKLACALIWLIKHPKKRIAMGKAGRKFAEKEFAIEKIYNNHLDIYKKLLQNFL